MTAGVNSKSLLCIFLVAGIIEATATTEPRLADEAIALAQRNLFNEAHRLFSALENPAKAGPEIHEIRFGSALTLLLKQPRTRQNLRRAQETFAAIAADHPDNDLGIASRYMLGRMLEVHIDPPDYKGAADGYLSIIDERPNHLFAQISLVRLIHTWLYRDIERESRWEKFRALEEMAPNIQRSQIKATFHYTLARAALQFNLSREAERGGKPKGSRKGSCRSFCKMLFDFPVIRIPARTTSLQLRHVSTHRRWKPKDDMGSSG